MAGNVQAAGNNKIPYLKHLGFNKRPFGAAASGADVFLGPQAATTIAEFRKGVATQDAVVTVSGRKGTGKTTLVHRSLDSLGIKYKTIRVGCLKMNSSEVLESLLVVLGVKSRPKGTMQRFAALRRTLKEHQDRNVRIFIVIEDAVRTGLEAIAEMEAMTAASAGESDGANIVIMGKENLSEFLNHPQLAELRERVTLRQTVQPLSAPELRGYLVHSFRQAGADFNRIFDAASVDLLYALSVGIPRRINRLAEAAMATAADKGLPNVTAGLVAAIARDKYGLSIEALELAASSGDQPSRSDAPASTPAAVGSGAETPDVNDIPVLIQDTLNDQKALAQEPDFSATLIPDATRDIQLIDPVTPDPVQTPTGDDGPPTEIVPELEVEDEDMATVVSVPGVIPDSFTDSLAATAGSPPDGEAAEPEFVPDLDALEIALAADQAAADPGAPAVVAERPAAADVEEALPSTNLHILDTLDESLQQPEETAAVELDQIAADIGDPAALTDVDDRLAETLFGSEFRCMSDEDILELQRNDDQKAKPADKPSDAGRPGAAVIPVAREVAVDGMRPANDNESGETAQKGRKL
ncbi:MAG: hypothetical protein KJO46_08880 [Gammaproteobacteria bacterium]|nr:hypothetical protein [Gammaproteobacteria bacterium]